MQIDFLEMWDQMGTMVKLLMGLLGVMSMWSVGVFFERLFTFLQAKKQSMLLVPQVAKHLKDGKLKEAIAASQSKKYRYSHVGKVILAGLQEYQFQVDTGVELAKDDVVDLPLTRLSRSVHQRWMLTVNRRRGAVRVGGIVVGVHDLNLVEAHEVDSAIAAGL